MEIKKEIEKLEKNKVVIGYICDQCQKKINCSDFPENWCEFISTHNSWTDSYEYHEVCSPLCYKKKVLKLIEDIKDKLDPEISDMTIPFIKLLCESIT